ncbi:hypothetical protein HK104_003389 [Borealophlyctis nickersoniae]|nr:hypothetical protein HK104_003389 [Borealophlyctis nickersoniae]
MAQRPHAWEAEELKQKNPPPRQAASCHSPLHSISRTSSSRREEPKLAFEGETPKSWNYREWITPDPRYINAARAVDFDGGEVSTAPTIPPRTLLKFSGTEVPEDVETFAKTHGAEIINDPPFILVVEKPVNPPGRFEFERSNPELKAMSYADQMNYQLRRKSAAPGALNPAGAVPMQTDAPSTKTRDDDLAALRERYGQVEDSTAPLLAPAHSSLHLGRSASSLVESDNAGKGDEKQDDHPSIDIEIDLSQPVDKEMSPVEEAPHIDLRTAPQATQFNPHTPPPANIPGQIAGSVVAFCAHLEESARYQRPPSANNPQWNSAVAETWKDLIAMIPKESHIASIAVKGLWEFLQQQALFLAPPTLLTEMITNLSAAVRQQRLAMAGGFGFAFGSAANPHVGYNPHVQGGHAISPQAAFTQPVAPQTTAQQAPATFPEQSKPDIAAYRVPHGLGPRNVQMQPRGPGVDGVFSGIGESLGKQH